MSDNDDKVYLKFNAPAVIERVEQVQAAVNDAAVQRGHLQASLSTLEGRISALETRYGLLMVRLGAGGDL